MAEVLKESKAARRACGRNSERGGRGSCKHMRKLVIQLRPTAGQAELIDQSLECCLMLWNRMIADEAKLRAELGRHFIPTPAKYKREIPALKQIDSLALSQLHKNLERAYRDHIFNPHDNPEPRPLESLHTYTTCCLQSKSGPSIRFEGGALRLPKLGSVPTALGQELPEGSVLRSAEVGKKDGVYFCTLTYSEAAMPAAAAKEPPERRTA